jgi:hypothetical protein
MLRSYHHNQNYPQLESLCTYCKAKFNHIEPIPCSETNCFAEFCSKECGLNHYNIRHKKLAKDLRQVMET